MAQDKQFRCQVITPEASVLDEAVDFVALTAHDGEIGVLTHRAPLLVKLGVGELRVRTGDTTRSFYVEGGFAHMLDNDLTVLTPRAEAARLIDPRAVERELEKFREQTPDDQLGRAAREQAMQRCAARLRVARNSN